VTRFQRFLCLARVEQPLRIRMCRQWTSICSPSNGSVAHIEGEANNAGMKASEATRTIRLRTTLFNDCGAPRKTGKSVIPKHLNERPPRGDLTKRGKLQLRARFGDELSPCFLNARPSD
jgi:hypothetical protein